MSREILDFSNLIDEQFDCADNSFNRFTEIFIKTFLA